MALGIGLERFESLRQDLVRGLPALAPLSSPSPSPDTTPSIGSNNNRIISLALTTTGAVTAVQSTYRYYSVMHQLQAGVFKPSVRGVLIIGISSVAIIAAVLRSELDHKSGAKASS